MKTNLYTQAAIITACHPMIGKRVADLSGPLQNEFWRFKLAGWVHDRNGKVEFA